MHAAVPAGCVSAPLAGSRTKMAIALPLKAATYTLRPSGLTLTAAAPPRARPGAHPPAPSSAMQPAAPGGWVRAPVAGSRSRMATALPSREAT